MRRSIFASAIALAGIALVLGIAARLRSPVAIILAAATIAFYSFFLSVQLGLARRQALLRKYAAMSGTRDSGVSNAPSGSRR